MPWRPQPMDPVYTPPAYPSHDYRGPGEIITVRCVGEVVGHLTRKDGDWTAIGWLPRPGLSADASIVCEIVEEILRNFARDGCTAVDAWAEVLTYTQHDWPVTGPLDGFRHPLAEE
ncbi:hypothetical protein [Micromonospora chersina]|uniref:hypothetical protein n=1 Tax=Micromonospora chersina TaxID=47854 RepID=UPI00371D57AF